MEHASKDEISAKEIFRKLKLQVDIIKKHFLAIIIWGVVAGALGFTYAYFTKPQYTASLTFGIEEEKGGGGLGGTIGLASQLGFDLGGLSAGSIFSGGNFIELLKSRDLIEKTLLTGVKIDNTERTLADLYMSVYGYNEQKDQSLPRKDTVFPVNAKRSTFTIRQDSLLGKFYKNILANNLSVGLKDKKLTIIKLDVVSESEQFSKFFSERLIEVASDFYITTKTQKALNNYNVLQRQADSIKAELSYAISGVAMATDQVFNLNPALNINRVPSTKRQVDVQANTAILIQLVQNLELAKVSLRKETPLVQLIDRPIFPLEKTKTSKLIFLLVGGIIGSVIGMVFFLVRGWIKSQK